MPSGGSERETDPSDARVVDTGPSVAVVGHAVFVGCRFRACVTAGAADEVPVVEVLVVVAMIIEVPVVKVPVVEVLVKENLAGKEHLAAIAAVLVGCGAVAVRQRRSGGSAGSDGPVGPDEREGPAGSAGRAADTSSGGATSGVPPIQS